jgi:hypothetical protein
VSTTGLRMLGQGPTFQALPRSADHPKAYAKREMLSRREGITSPRAWGLQARMGVPPGKKGGSARLAPGGLSYPSSGSAAPGLERSRDERARVDGHGSSAISGIISLRTVASLTFSSA